MTGIYNGIIKDATALPDSLDANLWTVQRGTRGPFAELSRISHDLGEWVRAVPGVSAERVQARLDSWQDVAVYTQAEQIGLIRVWEVQAGRRSEPLGINRTILLR